MEITTNRPVGSLVETKGLGQSKFQVVHYTDMAEQLLFSVSVYAVLEYR